MTGQQQIFENFQAHIFNLFMELAEQLNSLNDYLSVVEQCCSKYLGIDECCFLVCDGENLCHALNNESRWGNITIPKVVIDAYFSEGSCVRIPSFLAEQKKYRQLHYMIRLENEEQMIGVVLFSAPKENSINSLDAFVQLICKLFRYANAVSAIQQRENQYRKLYNITELFHSTMDIDRIIENVLHTVEMNFPTFNVDLILSNDQDRHTKMKVKLFDYLAERPSTIDAFVSGEITTEFASDLNKRLLNVPIKGRQAIYGILQISAPPAYLFSKSEKDFIRMLCLTSGNALENAKLYHQSHRLISDLQLINETTHRLNMKLSIHEMLDYLKKQLMNSFQPMEVCFVLIEEGKENIVEESTALFKTEQGAIYREHVKKHFQQTMDPLFIADISRLIQGDVQFKSLMAIPMLIEEKINGYAIVLHEEAYFFSFDSYKLMQSLIHHSSLAISNSILRNKLQQMVDRDHLTNLYARSYLDENVEKSLLYDDAGMFLLIDIDNFKQINDTYGHQVGDDILVQIAEQLKVAVGERGICARWGGEELAVYMPNMDRAEAITVAQNIVTLIPNVTEPTVTISAGLVTWNCDARPAFQEIFLHADKALYVAKNNGKNQVCLFIEHYLYQSQKGYD